MLKLHNVIFLSVVSLFIAGTLHAQTLPGTNIVQYLVSPEVPGPNQTVTIEAQGVGGFLGDSTITWQVNGTTVLAGVGERVVSFRVGGVGSQTRVHVVIDSPQNGTITHDFAFAPSSVNLLWEAHTSVPPLYRGKALYTPGSELKVIALPQVASGGSFVPANNLSFKWSVDGNPATQASGQGRNTITFAGNQLKDAESVSVDVLSGTTVVGSASIVIPAVQPAVGFYVKDPLRGILWDQALPSAISLTDKEITLQAQPYYFANNSIAAGSLSYTWTLGGQPTSGPESDHGVLTLRQTGSGAGATILGVDLQNLDTTKLLQAASAKLQIVFGAQPSSGGSSF